MNMHENFLIRDSKKVSQSKHLPDCIDLRDSDWVGLLSPTALT